MASGNTIAALDVRLHEAYNVASRAQPYDQTRRNLLVDRAVFKKFGGW